MVFLVVEESVFKVLVVGSWLSVTGELYVISPNGIVVPGNECVLFEGAVSD